MDGGRSGARAGRSPEHFPDTAIDFVTQDSRLVKPGSLFVALSGTPSGGFISSFASARDGWEFADKAEAAGAVAMIVPHRIEGIRVPQLVVKDTLIDGLWALARAARARFNGPVIGLTGSAGKTSTKEFIAAYPNAYASPSSFNNFWGVPLTLCNAAPMPALWVVEMGMNQTGEIARLSELTRPTVALVVNVQPVHLEKLGSLEAIRREKVVDRARPARRTACWCCRPGSRRRNGTARSSASAREPRCANSAHAPHGESWDVVADARQAGDRVQPDAGRAAPRAECAGGAGVGPCRRPRCGDACDRARPGRHHDRPRRRADRRRRHPDRRQFQRQSGQHGGGAATA